MADWPGATADEMARLVADPIERKLEDLPHLDYTQSQTQPGPHPCSRFPCATTRRPSSWTVCGIRSARKSGDIRGDLPDGVQGPYFNDEFGDTFGIIYAMTADGFTLPELKHVAEDVREQLLSIPGVGKIQLYGTQGRTDRN
ncbi:MAG: efflux RND transporter permease subunit [Acetobacteraceae bacterium]